jgi:hypothetical protein
MNTEGIGKLIATIINKRDPTKNRDLYCENEKKGVKNYIEELDLTDEDEIIQLTATKKTERGILYITGASGSGKSHFTREYIKQYHIVFPKNPIYLFSSLSDDPTLDKLTYIKRVELSPKFLNTDFTIEDFKSCLVIFDDTDCINNKYMKMKLQGIANIIMETGRHTRTSFIYTSHCANKGNETKTILNETHSITIFPNTCGNRTLKYLLENMFGLDRHQIKKIKQIGTTKSRAITIAKTYPMIVLHQKGAYTLRNDDS